MLIDADGNEYIVQNGKKKVISKGKHPKLGVTFDDNGNPVVLGKDGKPMKLETDKNGNTYVVNENGEKVFVNSSPPLKNVQVLKDENGNSYIMDAKGKRRMVQKDAHGNEYVLDEKGNKQFVNPKKK